MERRDKHIFSEWTRYLWNKAVKEDNSLHKIALGLSIGVFLGIFPGTGPVAALFLANLLHINRASALVASIATNTWLSMLLFLLSVKIGTCFLRLQQINTGWKLSQVILPVIIGYFFIGLFLAITVYITAIFILYYILKRGEA